MLRKLYESLFKNNQKKCPWCHTYSINNTGGSKKNPSICSNCHKKSYLPILPDILEHLIVTIYFYLLIYLFFAETYILLAALTPVALGLDYIIFRLWPLKKKE